MTLSVLFGIFNPHSFSTLRNQKVFCVYCISLPSRNRTFRYQHEHFPGMTSKARKHSIFLSLLLSLSVIIHMLTVILTEYAYTGSSLLKHQLEGVKIPDASVLFYFLYLQAQAFGLSENNSAAVGLKEVGADQSGHGALSIATNTEHIQMLLGNWWLKEENYGFYSKYG